MPVHRDGRSIPVAPQGAFPYRNRRDRLLLWIVCLSFSGGFLQASGVPAQDDRSCRLVYPTPRTIACGRQPVQVECAPGLAYRLFFVFPGQEQNPALFFDSRRSAAPPAFAAGDLLESWRLRLLSIDETGNPTGPPQEVVTFPFPRESVTVRARLALQEPVVDVSISPAFAGEGSGPAETLQTLNSILDCRLCGEPCTVTSAVPLREAPALFLSVIVDQCSTPEQNPRLLAAALAAFLEQLSRLPAAVRVRLVGFADDPVDLTGGQYLDLVQPGDHKEQSALADRLATRASGALSCTVRNLFQAVTWEMERINLLKTERLRQGRQDFFGAIVWSNGWDNNHLGQENYLQAVRAIQQAGVPVFPVAVGSRTLAYPTYPFSGTRANFLNLASHSGGQAFEANRDFETLFREKIASAVLSQYRLTLQPADPQVLKAPQCTLSLTPKPGTPFKVEAPDGVFPEKENLSRVAQRIVDRSLESVALEDLKAALDILGAAGGDEASLPRDLFRGYTLGLARALLEVLLDVQGLDRGLGDKAEAAVAWERRNLGLLGRKGTKEALQRFQEGREVRAEALPLPPAGTLEPLLSNYLARREEGLSRGIRTLLQRLAGLDQNDPGRAIAEGRLANLKTQRENLQAFARGLAALRQAFETNLADSSGRILLRPGNEGRQADHLAFLERLARDQEIPLAGFLDPYLELFAREDFSSPSSLKPRARLLLGYKAAPPPSPGGQAVTRLRPRP